VVPSFFLSALYIKAWVSPGHLAQSHKDRMQNRLGVVTHFNRWITNYFSSPMGIPKLHIDIKFKNYQKLSRKRDEAWSQGHLTTGAEDFVPGKIRYKGKTVKVKLRLKGDGLGHLGPDKWSLRIKVRRGDVLFGMRKFSIQHPMSRGYDKEVLFFKALEREGIMTLRYFFVNVIINGKDIGLMALQEHPSKELVESKGRRNSPILKFDDSLPYQAVNSVYGNLTLFFQNFRVLPLALIGADLEKQSEDFKRSFKIAVGLLRGFIEGELSASQVFDPVSTGRFLAIAKVWGAEHSLFFGNVRYYYNPMTAKLEMIGHDGKVDFLRPLFSPEESLMLRILDDEKIKAVYSETLKRLDKEFKEGVTFKWARKVQKENLEILHQEFFNLEGLDLNRIKDRAAKMVEMDAELISRYYPSYLNVYYLKSPRGKAMLEIVNTLPNSVVITAIKVIDRLTGKTQNIKSHDREDIPFTLKRTPADSNPEVKKIALDEMYNLEEYNIQVHSNVKGYSETRIYDAILYNSLLSKSPIPDLSMDQVLSRFSFLTQSSPNTLLIKPGQWNVSDWLFVPEGVKLIIPKGTVLRFDSSVGLIARGPVLIDGTMDEPVVLRGRGSEDSSSSWQGVFISNTEEASVWSDTFVLNTAGISLEDWNLSAGVTFYQAEVALKNVSFFGNLCEDALNIVHSDFRLEHVHIKNTLSDGFDSDFSKGTVEEGWFENIGSVGGGDAIDVSGTTINITKTRFKNIQDKAVSAGEKSTVKATQLLIESSAVGVASKDSSQVFLAESVIRESQVAAMMAYTKKKQYGPAMISAKNIKVQKSSALAVAQKGSQIFIDGVAVPTVDVDVKKLYATTMKPGLK